MREYLQRLKHYRNSPRFWRLRGYRLAVLTTMPRSGTWLSHMFFRALDAGLRHEPVASDARTDCEFLPSLRLAAHWSHSICPGFLEHYHHPNRAAWDALSFYVDGYNYGYAWLRAKSRHYSPFRSPHVKLVYIYRNLLDQTVSFYFHAQNHVDERHRYVATGKEQHYFSGASDFLRTAGIDSYLKQFLSYHWVKERFRDQLLMVRYEDLIADKARVLEDMLRFLRARIDQPSFPAAFGRALAFVEPASLQAFEKKLGHALGDDQRSKEESHLRGGEVGKWTKHYTRDDLAFAAARLRAFGLQWADVGVTLPADLADASRPV